MAEETRRVAIITGAGHGIGSATARELASAGWISVCADIDIENARRVAETVSGLVVRCDVSSEDDIIKLLSETVREYGHLDAIVSNAGVMDRKPLRDTTLADWNKVIATNLTAGFLFAKFAEVQLRAAKGAIVFVASTRAHMSEANTFAYSATKGALVALTHSLAITLGPDIRVNSVSPGWVNVNPDEPLSEADHKQHPAGRVGKPEDIAAAVSFLLSDRASFITGSELIVDGGMTRKMIYV